MLAAEFRQIVEELDMTGFEDESTRLDMVREVQRLLRRLSTPLEAAKRITWFEPTAYSAIRMGIDVGLFQHLGVSYMSTSDLAKRCNVEPVLMARTLRLLASNDYIKESAEGLWASTKLSEGFANPAVRSMFAIESGIRPIQRLPEFFKAHGYRNPDFVAHNPWKFGWKTNLDFYDRHLAHPEHMKAFNDYMAGYSSGRSSFSKDYACGERLIKGFDQSQSDVFLVDIGGGKGHDMMRLLDQISKAPGRIVLQDQPQILETATELDSAIEKLAHDFFTRQPIKGARAYYLHSIMHNWPEERALQVLASLTPALVVGYLKILIHDIVVPEIGASQAQTAADFKMMYVNGSLERTERLWYDLLATAGLKISGIWRGGDLATQSIIEVELA